jgi:hypothetical protein
MIDLNYKLIALVIALYCLARTLRLPNAQG